MATQHKNIVEADLHEPKGVSTSTAGKVYVANGSGSGTWALPNPKGSNTATSGQVFVSDGAGEGVWKKEPFGYIYFENIGSPYTLTYPAAYTKLVPTTTQPGTSYLVTEGTNAKLTYLGLGDVVDVNCTMSIDQAVGADRDLQFSLYKNGTIIPGATAIITASTGSKRFISLKIDVSLATNDYIEVYAKNNGGSGDIRVYTFSLMLDSH